MNETLFYDLKQTSGLTHSLADQVAKEVGRRIIAGGYRPGDLIEEEGALADRFQVSRSVVRDAVKILVGKNLLEVRRGIGTRVRGRHSWGLLDDDVLAWHLSAPPRPEFFRQLMDMRVVIEPEAARWAAMHGSDDAVAEIVKAQDRMEQEQEALEDFVICDALFHREILRASNNEILRAMEGVIFSALLTSIPLTNSDARKNHDSIPFHRDVADAIVARDPERAAACMKRLLVDAQKRLTESLKQV